MGHVGVKFAPADNKSTAHGNNNKKNHYYHNPYYVQKSWFGGLHLRISTYELHQSLFESKLLIYNTVLDALAGNGMTCIVSLI